MSNKSKFILSDSKEKCSTSLIENFIGNSKNEKTLQSIDLQGLTFYVARRGIEPLFPG
jgi:hypothetical protein